VRGGGAEGGGGVWGEAKRGGADGLRVEATTIGNKHSPMKSPDPTRAPNHSPPRRRDRSRDAPRPHCAHKQVERQQQREDRDRLVIKAARHRAGDVAGDDAHEGGRYQSGAGVFELLAEKVGDEGLSVGWRLEWLGYDCGGFGVLFRFEEGGEWGKRREALQCSSSERR